MAGLSMEKRTTDSGGVMDAQIPADASFISDIRGRITECGRENGVNEVSVDCGRGLIIKISGLSDTVTKEFAMNLYRPVLIEFGVQSE